MPKKVPGVPSQIKGGYHDTESIQKFSSLMELDSGYKSIKERFFDINSWRVCAKNNCLDFALFDTSGIAVDRFPKIGDYIKISPSKGTSLKVKDYLWVRIDMLDQSVEDRVMLQFRPSKVPGSEFAGQIMHFYASTSSSTMIISKGKDSVKFGIYGRNEKANHHTDFLKIIKNIFTSSRNIIPWKDFADGLVLKN